MHYMNKLQSNEQNIMSTTSKEETPEWAQWGDGKTNPKMKEYIEKLIKYNDQQIDILKETKDWLINNTNGNQSR